MTESENIAKEKNQISERRNLKAELVIEKPIDKVKRKRKENKK